MRKLNNHDVHKRYQNRLEEDVEFTINYGLPLSCLWSTIKDFSSDFEEKTEAFFILLKELLRRGHLKLQRDEQIIEHTPEEWERIFREVWPEYEIEPNPLPGYAPFDIGMWLTVEAPAYAVWIDSKDGSEYWAG